MTFDLASVVVTCPHCGFQRSTGLDERAAEIRAKGIRPEVSVSNADKVNIRAIVLFQTAHDHLYAGDKVSARQALHQAIEIQRDFLDAHLWLARIADDDAERREHLSSVLAYDPTNLEAMRMMLVLNGHLTSEQAERSQTEGMPVLRSADSPVSTQTVILRCPKCQGDMTADETTGRVVCAFCGHSAPAPGRSSAAPEILVAALLKRRAEAIRWVVGERILHCNACGAERTLSASTLSARCVFCGSNHVIEQDALGSFEQPDGIVPFAITRDQAGEFIKERLRSMTERLKGWFNDNKVVQGNLNGFYLPFWVFDVVVEVSRTRIESKPSNERLRMTTMPPYQQTKQIDALYDVEVAGFQSPPSEMNAQLGDYDLSTLLAYDPQMLARYPAQIYTIDFDRAALEARGRVAQVMRQRYQRSEPAQDGVSVHVFSNVQQMTFRLVLLPVWIATLVEADRDRRIALVNGQTGKVVLGRAERIV
ncbi:MAG: hypothetical protein JNJ61_24445 [Anaerolineae bacterium]|nr:hypothetical protein [Anaerolineae bacterium]